VLNRNSDSAAVMDWTGPARKAKYDPNSGVAAMTMLCK
jgi:hypothetical protein